MGAILPGPERDRAREAELMAELFGGIARERRGLDDEPPEEAAEPWCRGCRGSVAVFCISLDLLPA